VSENEEIKKAQKPELKKENKNARKPEL